MVVRRLASKGLWQGAVAGVLAAWLPLVVFAPIAFGQPEWEVSMDDSVLVVSIAGVVGLVGLAIGALIGLVAGCAAGVVMRVTVGHIRADARAVTAVMVAGLALAVVAAAVAHTDGGWDPVDWLEIWALFSLIAVIPLTCAVRREVRDDAVVASA